MDKRKEMKILDYVDKSGVLVYKGLGYELNRKYYDNGELMEIYNVRKIDRGGFGLCLEFCFSGKFLMGYKFYWG